MVLMKVGGICAEWGGEMTTKGSPCSPIAGRAIAAAGLSEAASRGSTASSASKACFAILDRPAHDWERDVYLPRLRPVCWISSFFKVRGVYSDGLLNTLFGVLGQCQLLT